MKISKYLIYNWHICRYCKKRGYVLPFFNCISGKCRVSHYFSNLEFLGIRISIMKENAYSLSARKCSDVYEKCFCKLQAINFYLLKAIVTVDITKKGGATCHLNSFMYENIFCSPSIQLLIEKVSIVVPSAVYSLALLMISNN